MNTGKISCRFEIPPILTPEIFSTKGWWPSLKEKGVNSTPSPVSETDAHYTHFFKIYIVGYPTPKYGANYDDTSDL